MRSTIIALWFRNWLQINSNFAFNSTSMKVKFYKLRALLLLTLTRFLGKILMVEVPPVVSVAGFIEREDGKVLFIDHSYIRGYGLPGGMVQKGESAEAALTREVKEETGLSVTQISYFASASSSYKKIPTISLSFIVKASGVEKDSEEGKIVWIQAREAVGKMAYGGSEITLQKYLSERNTLR
jgi:ADP-ribose pyrophosphatase YjhB (NUDIX family)